MKQLICLICFLLSFTSSFAQIVSYENIDEQVDNYLSQGLLVNASNTLVDLAHKVGDEGDSISALNYQMANLLLVEDHIDYFKSKGLDDDAYFANWYVSITLARALNRTNIAIPMFIKMLQKINKCNPFKRMPLYVQSLSYLLLDCTDPAYKDSVYLFQNTLNVIKDMPPTKELVDYYLHINKCFWINRIYNSFDGFTFVEDRLLECDDWFTENKNYIERLDTALYKKEIVQFYLDYSEILDRRATAYFVKSYNDISITIKQKEIELLNIIVALNDEISQKLAACYADIAIYYYAQGNLPSAKVNAEKAIPSLYKYNDDWDIISILSTLAAIFYSTHNNNLAANLLKEEISIKERLGIDVLCSDYSLYMLYSQHDAESSIKLGEELVNKYGMSDSSMKSVYRYLGMAYSKQMLAALRERKDVEAEVYLHKADTCFEKAETIILQNEFSENSVKDVEYALLYTDLSWHLLRQGDPNTAYEYANKSAQLSENNANTFLMSIISALLHKQDVLKDYLPKYLNEEIQDCRQMLPLLGSVESDSYLLNGDHILYRMPEIVSWNPLDSICLTTAYDATLLSKGIVLQISSITPYIKNNEELNSTYNDLLSCRDSIVSIEEESLRSQLAFQYETQERALRSLFIDDIDRSMSMSWKDIQKALSVDEVAIEIVGYQANNWVWSRDSIYVCYDALIVDKSNDTPIYINLIRQDDIVSVFDNQPQSYSADEGRFLYHKIWDTLDPYIKEKRNVYISPVGMLNLINIESLTDESGLAAFEKYNIHRLSSTRQICGRYSDMPKMNRVALFGGINYDDYDFSPSIPLDSLNTRGNWTYLSSTKEEIETIKHGIENVSSHTVLFSGKDATEKSLKKISHESPDILHLATHGYFIPKNKRDDIPYFKNSDVIKNIDDNLYYSGLAFANGEMNWKDGSFSLEANDGVLSAYEISKLNLSNTDLVVLSACETALGDRTFDGISGLQRAFKLAGVQTIIMSLWKVDDLATSFFMKVFYEGMIEINSKREAFIRAQKLTREKFEDPYYWAAFIMLD